MRSPMERGIKKNRLVAGQMYSKEELESILGRK